MRPTGAKGYRGMGHMANKAHRGCGVQRVRGTGVWGHRGYGAHGQWVTWVIGHMGNGAHGPWGHRGQWGTGV